ncbi:hydrophobic surface binding protein [Agrocybe pediades]|nr:hydrophobic surface binding protein [Agrocybe pediades]
MKFQSSLIVLASLVSAALSATIADVINDAHNISTQVTTLDNAINAFPNTGGSLVNALAIHTDAVNLGAAIDKGTADVIPVSEADGTTILGIVQGFEPTILNALSGIVAKKPAFQALPIGGIPALVKQDLINLNASTSKFEAQLIASAPADLVASAKAIKASVDSAFATAIAAYQ